MVRSCDASCSTVSMNVRCAGALRSLATLSICSMMLGVRSFSFIVRTRGASDLVGIGIGATGGLGSFSRAGRLRGTTGEAGRGGACVSDGGVIFVGLVVHGRATSQSVRY